MQLISPDLNLDEILEKLSKCKSFPVLASADMLHFIKTIRTKLLNLKLTLFPNSLNNVFIMSEVKELFGNGKEITDTSHVGKMRDIYPLTLFSLKNIVTLYKNDVKTGVLYFMPWVCWSNAVTNQIFTHETRLFLLKVTYEIFRRLYNIYSNNQKWLPNVTMFAKDENYVTFLTKANIERLLPTLVITISQYQYSLDNNILHFGFDRLGTHPLENFNGDIRVTANNNDTIVSTSHIIAKAFLGKQILRSNNIHSEYKGRINTGGIRIIHVVNAIDFPDKNSTKFVDCLFIYADAVSNDTLIDSNITKEYAQSYIREFHEFLESACRESKKLKCGPTKKNVKDIQSCMIASRYYLLQNTRKNDQSK